MKKTQKKQLFIFLSSLFMLSALLFGVFYKKIEFVGASDVSSDFESDLSVWNGAGISFSVDSSVYYHGSKSLKMVDSTTASTATAELAESKRFSVTSGFVYEVSAYYCSVNCSADTLLRLDLALYDSAGKLSKTLQGTTYSLNAGTKRSEWKKLITRVAIPDGVFSAAYKFVTQNGVAEIWADKLRCSVVEDETDIIVEYDDFTSFSETQSKNLRDFDKTQEIGEWSLESEKTPSMTTAYITRSTTYVADVSKIDEKSTALALCAMKNQGSAYVTKKITTLYGGDVYNISGHYKTGANKIFSYAGIKFFDYYGNELTEYEKSVQLEYSGTSDTSANEKKFSFDFYAPSNMYAKIYLGTPGYSGNTDAFQFYFRDIKITLESHANILSDISGMQFNTMSHETQSETAKSGYALKAVLNNNKTGAAESYFTFPGNSVRLQKNKNYVLSYDVKITECNGGIFSARINYADGTKTEFYTAETVGKTVCGWTTVTKEFSSDKNVVLGSVMFKNFGNSGTMTVFLDNVKLTEKYDYSGEIPSTSPSEEASSRTFADKTVAKVESISGAPTLTINGEKFSPMMYSYPSSDYAFLADTDDNLYKSGIELFVTFEGDLSGDAKKNNPLWREDGSIDYERFDKSVEKAVKFNPDGYVMVNIGLYAPQWWIDANPGELAKNSNGRTAFGTPALKQASFSSAKFREEAGEIVRLLIRHMKEQSYYNRVFGIKLSSGRTGEWMNYGSSVYDDVSPAATSAFQSWAEEKYSTVSVLNAHWKSNYSDFGEVEIPAISTAGNGIILDPATQRRNIDYYLFMSDTVAKSFLHYAKIVKTETNNEKIVGGYFGYSWFSASYGGVGTEHLALETVIASPYTDYVASPMSYSIRTLGYSSQFMAAQDTVQAYGKLYLLEQDNRTAAVRRYTGAWDAASDFGIGRTHTIQASVYELKRDFVYDFVNGNAFWYYDMFGGWFNDDQIYSFMNDAKSEYDASLALSNRENVSDVAVFLSNDIYSYMVNTGDVYAVYDSLIRLQKYNLSAMGTPFDVYKMQTLVNGKVPEHKVNVILSAYEITDTEKTAIDAYLKKNGQYIVWIYLCGVSDGGAINNENMSELIGFNVETETKNTSLEVKVTGNTGIAQGLSGLKYGNVSKRNIMRPYVTDATSAEQFGTYTDGGSCALAVRHMNGWTSVFSGGVNLPASLLRNIVKAAGAHVYSESNNDIIYANKNYVALHSGVSEEKTIKLNGFYAVYDVFAAKYVSRDTSVIEYYHEADDTKLFRLSEPLSYEITVINGENEYTETVKGSEYELKELSEKGRVFVCWNYNGAFMFAGETIPLSDDITIEAVFVAFAVEKGAEIRLDSENSGIRFRTAIDNDDKVMLEMLFGEVVFGTRVISKDIDGYLDIPTVIWTEKTDKNEYCGVVSGFFDSPESDWYNYRLAAKGYFEVTVNGEKKTFYSSVGDYKILAQIALDAYTDRKSVSTDEYFNYVTEKNLGEIYNGYSRFSDDELKALYCFAKHAKPEYYENVGDLSKW